MDFLSVLVNFATDLKEVFGDEYDDVRKYYDVVIMTGKEHTMMIKKHQRVMRHFLEVNKNNILNRDYRLREKVIKYSSGVSVNVAQLFSEDDPETNEAIWKHLCVLACSLDVIDKDILKTLHKDTTTTTVVDTPSPGMPDITSMMSMMSGLGGMMGGTDANEQAKLMTTMAPMLTNMMSDMKGNSEGKPDVKNILKSSMKAMGNEDVNPDDLLKNIDTIMSGLKHQIQNDSETKNAVKNIMRNFQKDFDDDDLDKIINNVPKIIEETMGSSSDTPDVVNNEID